MNVVITPSAEKEGCHPAYQLDGCPSVCNTNNSPEEGVNDLTLAKSEVKKNLYKTKAPTKSEDIQEESHFLRPKDLKGESKDSNSSGIGSAEGRSTTASESPGAPKKKKNPLLNFVELDTLGCGSFGRVVKVQKKANGVQYAMKVIEKKKMEKMNTIYQVFNERDLLSKLKNKRILKMRNCFAFKNCIYFVTDLAQRGDLSCLLKKINNIKMCIKSIQFIVGEIVQALEYLESVGVSHRDIKPENILVTEQGHLKLGDLGSAGISEKARTILRIKNHKHKDGVKEDGKLNTFVGTKEYVSPEVLKGKGCQPSCDMWSLGVIIFQLFTGHTPFTVGDGEFYIFKNIMECNYKIPDSVPKEAKDLIEKLLIINPEERLSATQVKNHEFFAGYDFEEYEGINSPLIELYELVKADRDEFESSCDYDSIVNGEDFDVDFSESPAIKKEILVTPVKSSPSKNYKVYLKSSSLGEKELLDLSEKGEKEEVEKEENFIPPRPYAKSTNTEHSKDQSSDGDPTYDSIQEPSTPTLKTQNWSSKYVPKQPLEKDEKKTIIVEGHIKKITAWIIYKRRYMELSVTDNVPRLVYYTANKRQLRNEIPLTKHTKVYSTGPSKFEIAEMENTYYFKDCGGEAKVKQWVNALTKAISTLSSRKNVY